MLLAVPGIREIIKPTAMNAMYNLNIVQHVKRNTEKNPCSAEPGYSFSTCLKAKVVEKVGCSLPWSNTNLANCSTLDQYSKFDRIYQQIADMNQRDVAAEFGCRAPCQYREFRLAEVMPFAVGGEETMIGLNLATTALVVRDSQLALSNGGFI